MKEKITEIIGESLSPLNLTIDDVIYEKVDGQNTLNIVLDSDEIIDLNKVVEATKIINPIIDEKSIINEQYILAVYAKAKGHD